MTEIPNRILFSEMKHITVRFCTFCFWSIKKWKNSACWLVLLLSNTDLQSFQLEIVYYHPLKEWLPRVTVMHLPASDLFVSTHASLTFLIKTPKSMFPYLTPFWPSHVYMCAPPLPDFFPMSPPIFIGQGGPPRQSEVVHN